MRILQVHKYLYRKAGAEAYLLGLADLLVKHGHEVGVWGTSEGARVQGLGSRIFEDLLVEQLNFDRREGLARDLKKVGQMIWSRESAQKFAEALKRFKPEVIHLHNIYHHLSPSILPVARRHGIPVVMSVHDFHLINPNYSLFDHGAICERQGFSAVAHRCIKNSFAATFADVVEWQLHKQMRVYEKHVAKFLVPTEFVRDKLVDSGVDERKIEVVPLPAEVTKVAKVTNVSKDSFVTSDTFATSDTGARAPNVLYAGRLVEEKGIYLLLEIAKQLPDIQFKIAGTGPELKNVELRIKNEELSNVELLGFVEQERLRQLIAGARLILVPSLWYEPSPLAVLEAMAAGKVVIASRIGGIPNLIKDGETGFLATAGEARAWVDQIQKMWHSEALLKRVGQAAQEYVKKVHDPEKHYEQIMEIYRTVLK